MINLELKIKGEELKQKLNIKDGVDGSPDTGEQTVDKINELPTGKDDPKIDASHIKNLPKSESRVIAGAASRFKELIAGENITITETKLGYPEISAPDLVPYTGATDNVDLGSFSLTSNGIISTSDIKMTSGKKFIFDG